MEKSSKKKSEEDGKSDTRDELIKVVRIFLAILYVMSNTNMRKCLLFRGEKPAALNGWVVWRR